jgi:hypothetical protein
VTKFVTGETFIGRYGDKKSAQFGDYWRSLFKFYLFAGFPSAWKSLQNASPNFLTFNAIFWYLVFQIYKARTSPNAHPELHATHDLVQNSGLIWSPLTLNKDMLSF